MKVKNLETRRSIREYTNQEIPKEVFEEILTAAQYAPTAVNTQAFKMIVVKRNQFDNETLFRMTKQRHALTADYNVFIYTLKKEAMTTEWMNQFVFYIPEDKRNDYSKNVIDHIKSTAILEATGHIVSFAMALEADAHGVGSTIYTGLDREVVAETFKNDISSDFEPVIGISFGYKSPDAIVYPKKLKPLSDFVTYKK